MVSLSGLSSWPGATTWAEALLLTWQGVWFCKEFSLVRKEKTWTIEKPSNPFAGVFLTATERVSAFAKRFYHVGPCRNLWLWSLEVPFWLQCPTSRRIKLISDLMSLDGLPYFNTFGWKAGVPTVKVHVLIASYFSLNTAWHLFVGNARLGELHPFTTSCDWWHLHFA